jgi:hypothetical protein
MPSAIANDLVLKTEWMTGTTNFGMPGITHLQVLSTQGAQKAALVVTLKDGQVGGGSNLVLEADVEGSNDLVNWDKVRTDPDVQFTVTNGANGTDQEASIALAGWAWVRVRYRLRSTTNNYGATPSRVLLTSTLSVGG